MSEAIEQAEEIARNYRKLCRRSKLNGKAQRRFMKQWAPLWLFCPNCQKEFIQAGPEHTTCGRRACEYDRDRRAHQIEMDRIIRSWPKCYDCGTRTTMPRNGRCGNCADDNLDNKYAASLLSKSMGLPMQDFPPEILKAKMVHLRALRAIRENKTKQ